MADNDPHVGEETRRKAHLRLEKRLLRQVGRAIAAFDLIGPGDKIMVAISGGKDSWAMLHLLRLLQQRAPFAFELLAVNLDQGHPGFPAHVLRDYLESEGHPYRLLHVDTYQIVKEKIPEGKTQCSLCSRLRRGVLYRAAIELGCNKIALGHHRDDLIETLMLNLLYSGSIKSMAPRLSADDGKNTVIRPLSFCPEEEIAAYAAMSGFPIVPCDLCGSQPNLQRQNIKRMLADLERANPKIKGNLFASLSNVVPSHLMDAKLTAYEDAGDDPFVP